MNRELRKNFLYAFIAQLVSLVVSCSSNLILPKFMSTVDFSYWQLFMFYILYIPCLALGLNDGVYLRYGGMRRDNLDYDSIKSQYIFGLCYQLVLAIVVGSVLINFSESSGRKIVMYFVLVYYIIYTAHNFLSYIFQAVNDTNIWSKSIIMHRVFFLSAQIVLLGLGIYNVFYFIPSFIFALLIALVYLVYKIHYYFKNAKVDLVLGVKESMISIRVGISLMIANVCSTLILGIGRLVIDNRWGLLTFGKVSFSLTLINFALTFISQVGLVLFPALRRVDIDNLKLYYQRITMGLFYLLPLMYTLYLPLKYILMLWLPKYSQSIDYLSIILPICFFDSKMNLIGNTFLKVLNKQFILLKINISTILICGMWGFISAYIYNNLNWVILGMVVSIIFRSIVTDYILEKELGLKMLTLDMLDIVLATIFIISALYTSWGISCVIVTSMYVLRSLYVRKKDFKLRSGLNE